MSPTERTSLSPRHLSQLAEHIRDWTRIRLSTAPADRQTAEEGVILAYAAAGYPPPRRIIWGGGPVDIARSWARGPRGERAGGNLKSALIDKPRHDVDRKIRERVRRDEMAGVLRAAHAPDAESLDASVERVVAEHASAFRPSVLTRIRRAFRRPSDLHAALNSWRNFEDAGCAQHDFHWLGAAVYLRDALGLAGETALLNGLAKIAASAGWIVPHEYVCWLGERHHLLRHDPRGRLHSEDGPALAFPDGWQAFVWKDVAVPAALIDQRSRITAAAIERERNMQIRRCMIDMMTPQRYIAEGAAHRLGSDDCGTLWLKLWPNGESWAAVEVVNGTPEPDGQHKHYFLQVPTYCRTPREAVAWTYGMSERQYARLALRS
ncbi:MULTISPECIES: DUF6745 domain-containing protein [Rhodomicrobium]|uniref:DUF6745 domain-containing protein n=1 Tax=Rhodomicrobium TaxID=1068 RepID=UPI000B4AA5F6|nr:MULTISPECIES: hypothetical protein [Rhodomicrobium]